MLKEAVMISKETVSNIEQDKSMVRILILGKRGVIDYIHVK